MTIGDVCTRDMAFIHRGSYRVDNFENLIGEAGTAAAHEEGGLGGKDTVVAMAAVLSVEEDGLDLTYYLGEG